MPNVLYKKGVVRVGLHGLANNWISQTRWKICDMANYPYCQHFNDPYSLSPPASIGSNQGVNTRGIEAQGTGQVTAVTQCDNPACVAEIKRLRQHVTMLQQEIFELADELQKVESKYKWCQKDNAMKEELKKLETQSCKHDENKSCGVCASNNVEQLQSLLVISRVCIGELDKKLTEATDEISTLKNEQQHLVRTPCKECQSHFCTEH